MNGATLTRADDADSAAAGIQFNVRVVSTGLGTGADVDLYVNPGDAGATATSSTTLRADGTATFMGVTLPSGRVVLEARTRAGGLRSAQVIITVMDVPGACAGGVTVTFVEPEPPAEGMASITLGPSDDTDGEACGETFTTRVQVSTTAAAGSTATLFVNGTPRGETTVMGSLATFTGVVLDNRGTTPNELAVEVQAPMVATPCRVEFPGEVRVDCDGVSCAITQPDTTSAFLNQSNDVSDAPGFQTDFEVTTDADALGTPVKLVIDGDESGATTAIPTPVGSGAAASFGNVELAEGLRRVQAVCTDASGNVTRSGIAEWTVDITPCVVEIASPSAGAMLTTADDEDTATAGVQVSMSGTITGDACVQMRAGICSGLDGMPLLALDPPAYSSVVTLSSSPSQDLCVHGVDEAGNIGVGTVTIGFRGDGPQVEIVTPATGTNYNIAGGVVGTTTYTADLNPATPTCEAAFVVNCTDVGTPVTLHRAGDTSVLASADCVAMAGLPAPFAGQASFASVALPLDTSFSIVAEQTVGGLVGLSSPVALTGDCSAPAFNVTRPTCGTVLHPSTEDENTAMAGFQYRVVVSNTNTPPPDVTLTIRSGATVVYTATSTVLVGTTNQFVDASFGAGGLLDIQACGTDPFGNQGCSPACSITVADTPTVNITAPTNGQILGASADCNAGAAGFQLQINATTDAIAGSAVSVQVGALAPVMTTVGAGGSISICTDAPQGVSIRVVVTVTDSRGAGTGMVIVTIDSLPPTTPIGDLSAAAVVDRRGGLVRLQWTSVADTGGGALDAYHLRCSTRPITTETEWGMLTDIPGTPAPAMAGAIQSQVVSGFRPGETRYCVIRATDAAGAITPLSPAVVVTLTFTQQTVTSPVAGVQLGGALQPVGDVNGDGIDDVLSGSLSAGTDAFLYFGSAGGLPAAPSVRLSGVSGSGFGIRIVGIGDFNGDGRGDFAIGAPNENSNKGAVYVFYGRASTSPWPSNITISTSGCAADICFRGDDGAAGGPDETALLGRLGAAGDFNGDGFMDLAVGASGANTFVGRVYILLGSSGFAANAIVSVPGAAGMQPSGFVIDPPSMSGNFGSAIAPVGAHSAGDALHDIIIGAPGRTTTGAPGRLLQLNGRAYSGTGLVLIAPAELIQIDMADATLSLASVVTNLGDYNGDGRIDIAAIHTSGLNVNVYLGSSSGSFMFVGTYANDSSAPSGDAFGGTMGLGMHPDLGRIGDLDGDSRGDTLLGSTELGTPPGAVHLDYGKATFVHPILRSTMITFQPTTTEATAVRVAAYIGDVNQDGFPDFAIGDPSFGSNAGRFLIHY